MLTVERREATDFHESIDRLRSLEEVRMGLFILLLVLALIFGGLGLFIEGLKWLLIIAAVLFVLSFFSYGRTRTT